MLITVLLFKIILKRCNVLANPEVEKNHNSSAFREPFSFFLQLGFTGLYRSWNTANLIRSRKIKVSDLYLVLFHADIYQCNMCEACSFKRIDKKEIWF